MSLSLAVMALAPMADTGVAFDAAGVPVDFESLRRPYRGEKGLKRQQGAFGAGAGKKKKKNKNRKSQKKARRKNRG